MSRVAAPLTNLFQPAVAAPLRTVILVLLAIPLLVSSAAAQTFIDEIRVRVLEPSGGAVRPLEEMILEVEAHGRLRSKDGQEIRGRLPVDGAVMAFARNNSGWLSKAYQCPNFRTGDYVRERTGGWRGILGTVQNFALKSCYVYTAPYETGEFLVQASIDGVAGDLRLKVSSSAPSTRKPEGTQFPPEASSQDPYFPLVEYYAPFIAQETWFNPLADAITRFDYDGDFQGDNNWNNLGEGSSQAYVYYAVMETDTHWFLHYNFFHPRDYSDTCIGGTCHENDNEGLILAVRKDGTRFGKPEVMQTLAHDILFTYANDERVQRGAHEVNAPLVLHEGSHPMVFIEAGGHGVLGIADRTYSLFEHQVMDWLPFSTGITYVYKGVAERPFHAGATHVGYALLPIYEHWWLRSDSGNRGERSFADFYTYQPYGDRPVPPMSPIAGAFLGTREAANKAKPFWGWHDDRTLRAGILARGQWGLDPAYGFSRNLRFPDGLPMSLQYTFNPYLGIGAPSGARVAQTTARKETVAWAPSPQRPVREPVTPGASAPQPRTAATTGEPAHPSTGQAGPATPGTPTLGGFGEFARPGDGWSSPPQAEPAKEGISGWDPAPNATQPAQASPPAEGLRGWGTQPPAKPKENSEPKGWGMPASPPKNAHE